MDTMIAFARGAIAREAGSPTLVFDWDKAARLIQQMGPVEASAGLRADWGWTAGTIYRDGEIVPKDQTYVYLASIWDIPTIEFDACEQLDCFLDEADAPEAWLQELREQGHEDADWAHVYWPASARAILVEPRALPIGRKEG